MRSGRKSVAYALGGQGIYMVTQLSILSTMAHFSGPEDVGRFGLAMAVATPLFMFANMGLRAGQSADVEGAYTFAEYAGFRTITSLAALFLGPLAMLIAAPTSTSLVVLVMVSCNKFFESISDLSYGAFQARDRMDFVAVSQAARGFASALFFFLAMKGGASLELALAAQLTVWALVGVLIDYSRAASLTGGGRFVVPSISVARFIGIVRQMWPLAVGLLMNSVQGSIPRIAVARMVGLEALGIFTAVAYFQQAGVTLANSVSHALISRFARMEANQQQARANREAVHLSLAIALVATTVVLVAHLLADQLLHILFGPEFGDGAELLGIILLAVGLRMVAAVPTSLLHARRQYSEFMHLQLATVVLTLGASFALVPLLGVSGAAWTLVGAAAFRLLSLIVLVLRGRP